MVRKFFWRWLFAAVLVVGAVNCSDSDDADGRSPSDPNGDFDDDGVLNSEDDSDDDGTVDSEDDDIDGDGIPNDSDSDADGDGVRDSDERRPGSSGGSAGSGPGGGGLPSTLGGQIPQFPGSGTSDAGDPLPGAMLCDAVPLEGETLLIPGGGSATCFFDKNDPTNGMVAATLEQVLECVEETDTIHLRLTFHPWFVDNTYGANSIGWPERRGHTWKDLVGSDHAEFILKDDAGNTVMQFKLDYISEDPSAPSGYDSLGVMGGDGKIETGDESDIVRWSTSIERNLNERGYTQYLPPDGSDEADSPATDENYSPNPDAPEWDFRVVYEVWIDASIFEDGFGGATIEYVHASPAKAESNTIETTPGECPPPPPPGCPDNDPDTFCGEGGSGGGGSGGTGGDGPPPPGCVDNDPDTFCGEGGSGSGGNGGGTGGTGGGGSGGSGGSGGDGSSGRGGSGGDGSGGNGGDPCEDGDPDTYCGSGGNGGDPQDPCDDNDPDTVCGEGGSGPGGDPQYCSDHPEDPICMVD